MNKRILFTILILLVITLFFHAETIAQCPMCKIGAESNMRDGGTAGNGLNKGILYMFAMPYLLVATLGYLWYRNKKNYDKKDPIVAE